MVIAPTLRPPQPPDDEIEYPTGDGEPMAETDLLWWQTANSIFALKSYFANDPDTYVSGDNFIYYVEGDNQTRVSPDCYVVFGVGNALRDCYKVWKEQRKMPDVVFEFTSKSTQQEDTGKKFQIYERVMAVPEYFLFDPTGDYLNPILQGYRLVNGRYIPLVIQDNRLYSEQLKLELVIRGETMRFFNPTMGKWLLTLEELKDKAKIKTHSAEAEALARVQADQHAEVEAQRAEVETQARLQAEARIAQLMAELERLRRHE
ncbi:MAG TPA: Uma2 family endonuclease [Chthonomonadaceae bacterium]|nr:Uma2 family endonuclease [Chthonomonadaceae bacterium]